MATKTIKHNELRNGDRVWVQGNLFTVSDLRTYAHFGSSFDMTGPPVPVIRYTGTVEGEDYGHIKGTGYNGATYGARFDYPCTIEV